MELFFCKFKIVRDKIGKNRLVYFGQLFMTENVRERLQKAVVNWENVSFTSDAFVWFG